MKNNIFDKYKKEYTIDGESRKFKVKRKYLLNENNNEFYTEIKNVDLLPGDIIFLKTNDSVPCDCLIIEGECMVNESSITGSLDIYKKVSLQNNNELFNYKHNKVSILLHGMKIIKTFSKTNDEGLISVLCINTGPSTYKANQLSNVVYFLERKKQYNDVYSFFGNRKIIIIIYMIASFLFSIIIAFFYYLTFNNILNEIKMGKLVYKILLRNFCKSLMSVFFITNSMLILLSTIRLRNENIICFDKSRLLNSDKINTIIFSKIGTLCQNIFEIEGYHPVHISSCKLNQIHIKNYKRNQCKEVNNQLLKYYKEYLTKSQHNSYMSQNFNPRNELRIKNINKKNYYSYEYAALFLECLLSCNNIEKIKDGLFGNKIEVNIFDDMKWDLKIYDTNNENENLYTKNSKDSNYMNNNKYYCDDTNLVIKQKSDIFPKNYYSITESLKLDALNHHNKKSISNYLTEKIKKINENELIDNSSPKDNNYSNAKLNHILEDLSHTHIDSYKLRIYKKFIKDGTLNSSAIVYNFITKQLRFMVRGIPEDILDKCDENSLPENFENNILFYRKNGYIILVCATKLLNIYEYNDLNGLDYYMNDLTFCGFITLKNKLKENVKNSIVELKQLNCNLIMTSGDNEYNCLSASFDCGIIENKNVFVFDKEDKSNKVTITEIYRTKIITEATEENEDTKTNISYDKYSKQNLKNELKKYASPFGKSKEKILLKQNDNSPNRSSKINQKKTNSEKVLSSMQSDEQGNNNNSTKIKYENKINSVNKNNENKNKVNYSTLGGDSDIRLLNFQTNFENNVFPRNRLYSQYSRAPKNKLKDKSKRKRISKVEPFSPFTPKINKKLKNKLKSSIEDKDSFNINKNSNYKSYSSSKKRNLSYIEKKYYYKGIFNDNKELEENSIFCISGKLFSFLYKNKKNRECKYLLEKIHLYAKIFFYMSAIDKSLLVDFFREYKDDYVCKIGNCQNDIDSIISSNLGIYLREPKNQNTILSHFYSSNSDILCIKSIIMEGRVFSENILLLEMSSFFCTLSINSYILCCFIRNMDVIKGQLNFLEASFLILSLLAFSGKPNNNIIPEPLARNKTLSKYYYIILFIGLLFIKMGSIYVLCSLYRTDILLWNDGYIDEIFCTYYFLLIIEHLISAILFFNCISFYKRSPFTNFYFALFLLFLVLYYIILITLNSSNFKFDFIKITVFEYSGILLDSFSDKNRFYVLVSCLFDFVGSLIYLGIINFIFSRIARYISSKDDENIKQN
jgi:magnesium-transporting ATPase (P-type)